MRTIRRILLAAVILGALATEARAQLALPISGSCDSFTGTAHSCFSIAYFPLTNTFGSAIEATGGGIYTGLSAMSQQGYAVEAKTGAFGGAYPAIMTTGVGDAKGIKAVADHSTSAEINSVSGDAIEAWTGAPGSMALGQNKSVIYAHHNGTVGTTYGTFVQTASPGGHSGHFVNTVGGLAIYANGPAGGTGGWMNLSDRRAKKEIIPIVDGLGVVNNLRPVEFSWKDKDKPAGRHVGFVAQELGKALPAAVSTDRATGLKMADYTAVIPALVAGMQQQQREIQSLKAQLAKR